MNASDLKLGMYEHFKGNQYEVIGIGKHSETLEGMVVYRALYGKGELWIRPVEIFLDEVVVDGLKKPRFRYISAIVKKA
jgi:cyclomaltodextrinase / maltogenic alpha-amylase / neopullulanase